MVTSGNCISDLLKDVVSSGLNGRGLGAKSLSSAVHQDFGCSEATTYPLLGYVCEGYVFCRIGGLEAVARSGPQMLAKRARQVAVTLYALEVAPDAPVISDLKAWYQKVDLAFEYPPMGTTPDLQERVRRLPARTPRLPRAKPPKPRREETAVFLYRPQGI